jgi:hypothetical protein
MGTTYREIGEHNTLITLLGVAIQKTKAKRKIRIDGEDEENMDTTSEDGEDTEDSESDE